VSHSFENGIESNYFTINGNTSSSKGSVTYNGVTYSKCLKIESSTSITFTTTETMQLTLVLGGSSNNNIKIDGEKVVGTTNVIVVTLEAGTHTITKADTTNLFYIALDAVAQN
ncbi:MAG: pectate lyase, partial [Clostridia bacterium]|nr:pectate lyase [Clostridia bacterium]